MYSTVGPTAYLAVKAKGDNSPPSKRRMIEDVYVIAPPGPRGMVKARLLEAQCPVAGDKTHRYHVSTAMPSGIRETRPSLPNTSPRGTMLSESIQGHKWDTYPSLERRLRENTGSPTGGDPYGDGVPIVDGPTIKGEQDCPMDKAGRYARCGTPKLS